MHQRGGPPACAGQCSAATCCDRLQLYPALQDMATDVSNGAALPKHVVQTAATQVGSVMQARPGRCNPWSLVSSRYWPPLPRPQCPWPRRWRSRCPPSGVRSCCTHANAAGRRCAAVAVLRGSPDAAAAAGRQRAGQRSLGCQDDPLIASHCGMCMERPEARGLRCVSQ